MREPWQLRAEFAGRLSELYGREVPAHTTLVDVAHEVNREVVDRLGDQAQRLGSRERLTAERHGAIRVGTPAELARNPFRVFTSLLARGIALTRAGRALYDQYGVSGLPETEKALAATGLGVFTITAEPGRRRDGRPPKADPDESGRRRDGRPPGADLAALLDQGWLTAEPVVYEDFLPRSAAGIFASNLSAGTTLDDRQAGADLDAGWLAGALGRPLLDPDDLYQARARTSLRAALAVLDLQEQTG